MQELNFIYKKHKNQLVPAVFFLAAFFVVFRIILPQWSDIQNVSEELSKKNISIESLNSTLNVLNGTPDEVVDRNYELVTTALPVAKDIVLIFNELNAAADKSSVKLGGFSLKVGGVYSKQKTNITGQTIAGIPYLNILVKASGDTDKLKDFASVMYKSIPLIEIKTVDISKKDAQYESKFFFNPISLRSNGANSQLTQLSESENSLLKQLGEWSTANK
jgi:hypothetical protein